MTPLPPPLGSGELTFWRLDEAIHASTWSSGEGSYLAGGRWSSVGMHVVYAALDPATAILEVAVHKGFHALDTDPHVRRERPRKFVFTRPMAKPLLKGIFGCS